LFKTSSNFRVLKRAPQSKAVVMQGEGKGTAHFLCRKQHPAAVVANFAPGGQPEGETTEQGKDKAVRVKQPPFPMGQGLSGVDLTAAKQTAGGRRAVLRILHLKSFLSHKRFFFD
jgi:hypothetical protein